MAYFSCISEPCKTRAKEHGVLDDVVKQAQKIENLQSIDLFVPIGSFREKPLGKSFRLFMFQVDDKQDHLIVLFNVLPRSSPDCKKIQHNHGDHESIQNEVLDSIDLKKIWAEKRASPDIPEIPPLSDSEKEYLYTQFENPESWLILESDEWLKRTDRKNRKFHTRIGELFSIVCDMYSTDKDQTELFDHNGLGVLCRKFTDEKILYLIAPILENQQEDITLLKENIKRN